MPSLSSFVKVLPQYHFSDLSASLHSAKSPLIEVPPLNDLNGAKRLNGSKVRDRVAAFDLNAYKRLDPFSSQT
jgi:hypothetical protein